MNFIESQELFFIQEPLKEQFGVLHTSDLIAALENNRLPQGSFELLVRYDPHHVEVGLDLLYQVARPELSSFNEAVFRLFQKPLEIVLAEHKNDYLTYLTTSSN